MEEIDSTYAFGKRGGVRIKGPLENVFKTACEINLGFKSNPKGKIGDKMVNNIFQWFNGTMIPTFNQIEIFW